jgi:hypothetical protein
MSVSICRLSASRSCSGVLLWVCMCKTYQVCGVEPCLVCMCVISTVNGQVSASICRLSNIKELLRCVALGMHVQNIPSSWRRALPGVHVCHQHCQRAGEDAAFCGLHHLLVCTAGGSSCWVCSLCVWLYIMHCACTFCNVREGSHAGYGVVQSADTKVKFM